MRRIVLFPLALLWVSFACPAAAVADPPVSPAPPEPLAALAGKVESLYQSLHALTEKLPFSLGAGLYLWYYQPLSSESVLSGGNLEGTLQTFFYYFKLDAQVHGFGAHIETRMRDGGHLGPSTLNNYFRDFYSSNIWLQEGYAFWSPLPALTVKAGKLYRRVGIFWDDSFFGNLQFYDGLKLNPDYGISVEGEVAQRSGPLSLGYAVQFFLNSDGIDGGVNGGRQVTLTQTDATTGLRLRSPNPEGELDAKGAHMTSLKNIAAGRVVLGVRPGKLFGVEVGGSGLTGTVVRATAMSMTDEAQMTHVAGDVTFFLGPALLYAEYLRQFGPGVRDADYVLAGVRGSWRWFSVRVNASYVDYHLAPDVEEFILQPGVTLKIGGGLSLMLEFNEWERRDPQPGDQKQAGFAIYDRSLNTSLVYAY